MPISTIFTALFYPYIARERTALNLILSVRSERSALCLKERHRSQNEGSLKSEERLSDFKEQYAQLWIFYLIIGCGDLMTLSLKKEETRVLRRQLFDKRPIVENKLLSGRQFLASEPTPSDTSDSDSKFTFS